MEPFDAEQIKLADINVSKSPGPDGIPTGLWFVCCIFNTPVRTGVFPQQWKQANVVSVTKV